MATSEKEVSLKIVRRQRKAALTRHLGTLDRLVAEEDSSGVEERLEKLRQSFLEFESSHDIYHNTLGDDEIDESEEWFRQVELSYITGVKSARSWLKTNSNLEEKSDDHKSVSIESSSTLSDLINVLTIPKVEIEAFNGDPLNYQAFIVVFDEVVDSKSNDDQLKLSRLLQYTAGPAKAAIRNCALLGGDVGYSQAREILKDRFGNPNVISRRIIDDLKNGKIVTKPAELQQLGDDLSNALVALGQLGSYSEVNTQQGIMDVLRRCQPYVRNRWRDKALKTKSDIDRYPTFGEFVRFVKQLATEACDPLYGSDTIKSNNFKSNCNVITPVQPIEVPQTLPCVICGLKHRLFYCDSFKSMNPKARLDIVIKNQLCFNCLLPGHGASRCNKQSVCSVPGCGRKHTKFIHVDILEPIAPAFPIDVNRSANVSSHVNVSNSVVYLPVVPVKVNGHRAAYALLDSGSTNTFITQRLAQELGIEGIDTRCKLNTLNSTSDIKSKMVSIQLTSLDDTNLLETKNVLVVQNIPVRYPCNAIDISEFPHLKDLPIGRMENDIQADLLIGMDNSAALMPMDVRFNQCDLKQPYATLTLFGWSLNGCLPSNCLQEINSNFVDLQHPDLNTWSSDDFDGESNSLSPNDKHVLDLWENEIDYVNGHYVLPIPWRQGRPSLPNNRFTALARLKNLSKRLEKTGMTETYNLNIHKLISDGYAEPVPVEECTEAGAVWYLPHHAVINDRKPGKVRVVFDCAALHGGVSLNSQCFQGPDLNNKLLHVLLRFREYEYAIMADIESMYHQIKIPLKDRNVLRFLWNVNGKVVDFRMTSHLFGGVWCASSSTFGLRQTVQDFPCSDFIKNVVFNSFYVDDLLQSVRTRQEASTVISECCEVLARGGFNLTKFVVNNGELLQGVVDIQRAKEVRDITSLSDCKAVGIKWDVSKDTLYYIRSSVDEESDVTCRIMLSKLHSIYDPLGLISPLLIQGKILFQETCRLKLNWDDLVPNGLAAKWQLWLSSLAHVSNIKISRCVVPSAFVDGVAELHHFCDASEVAYGACSYLRIINQQGEIHVSLLVAKVHITPLKPVTVPRLELLASVLAARLDNMLRKQLTMPLINSTFWTDSQICLAYINNDSKRFKTFVANRVAIIREYSDPNQWCHVRGLNNPADVLSRGCLSGKLPECWLNGPPFLAQHKSEWSNVFPCLSNMLDGSDEVKKSVVCFGKVDTGGHDVHPLQRLTEYFSSYYKLKRAICWLLRVKSYLLGKGKVVNGHVTVQEMSVAESLLVGFVQHLVFDKEIKALESNKNVPKTSVIYKLSPVLDNGLLVVGGRLKYACVSNQSKHPYILPPNHRLSSLIVHSYHDTVHLGTEWTLSHLIQRFWITHARNLVKKIKSDCVTCKKLYARPMTQKMADLPASRCGPNKPPFSYVGCDIFGPVYVRYGRSMVKRYGCVFTCFTTRAIHLEVLSSLETDTFINGLCRFISRRGCPEKVWSDNGTNLVGARKELSASLKTLNRNKVVHFASRRGFDWAFNPPLASHHGGVWERMIRTIRKILYALLSPNVRMTDDVLNTLMCEIECIVNSRPITKCSDDPTDESPLTPNHLLLLRENSPTPWGVFQSGDAYRKRWRQVQLIANQFWSKWVKQYLPELQMRQKWNSEKPDVKVGDLVLLVDEGSPRGTWPLGLVIDVNVGRDGHVRSVRLKTRSTQLVRPITKLVHLENSVFSMSH